MLRLIEVKFFRGWFITFYGDTPMSALCDLHSDTLEILGLDLGWYTYPNSPRNYGCLTFTFLGFSLECTIGREMNGYSPNSDEDYTNPVKIPVDQNEVLRQEIAKMPAESPSEPDDG